MCEILTRDPVKGVGKGWFQAAPVLANIKSCFQNGGNRVMSAHPSLTAPPPKKGETQLTGAAGRRGKHTFTNSKLRSAFPQRTRGWAPTPPRLTVTVLFLGPGARKGPMSLRKEKENIKGWEGLFCTPGRKWGKGGRGVGKFCLEQGTGRSWERRKGVWEFLPVPELGIPPEVTFLAEGRWGRGAACRPGLQAPAAAAPGTRGRPGPG